MGKREIKDQVARSLVWWDQHAFLIVAGFLLSYQGQTPPRCCDGASLSNTGRVSDGDAAYGRLCGGYKIVYQ